jgi:hypothetical protein
MKNILSKLKELSTNLSEMSPAQLKEWSDKTLNDSKKLVPIRMSGNMLPPEDYTRPIDRYLDDVFEKGSFR